MTTTIADLDDFRALDPFFGATRHRTTLMWTSPGASAEWARAPYTIPLSFDGAGRRLGRALGLRSGAHHDGVE
jgi:hypothetical protein